MAQISHDTEKQPSFSASEASVDTVDAEFGGTEERKRMEKKLVRMLDIRLTVIVTLYLLNFVGPSPSYLMEFYSNFQ